MADYEPLDLSGFCNAGAAECCPGRSPAVGECSFRGLPFRIGAGPGKPCFVAFGPQRPLTGAPVSIPVMQRVQSVVFAHALVCPGGTEVDQPGREVARYVFALDGGDVFEVPIRERFEIAAPPYQWGKHAFGAAPDMDDGVQRPRLQGPYDAVGYRQTEVIEGAARDYYLWVWRSPKPDRTLARIDLVPTGATLHRNRPFMVAGLTLGFVDEDPLYRPAAVPVALTLKRPEDADAPFDLDVDVDRGTAGYPYPLPRDAHADRLAAPQRGWGDEQNSKSSPAYVDVAAAPSATVTVRRQGETLGQARWGDLQASGAVDTSRVRFEVAESGRNWVHTTVVDDTTGAPLPCRVAFMTEAGIPYAPHGHHAHVNSNMGTWHIDVGGDVRMGQISYAYIDGRCQGWLPRGRVVVDAARGYEYEPLREVVEIKPGQRELTVRLKRLHNLADERWFAGDTHVHFLSAQGALLEASAEGVQCVNLMQSQWGHLFTNTEEFTGRPVATPGGETIVWVSQENRQHVLGHMSLLGLKAPVMPWCSDGPSEAELGGNMETTLARWADACRAQGGTVVMPHFPFPNGEPAALVATGRVDAVEMIAQGEEQHAQYYRYLNGGYRLPLVGGTDKMDSGVPVGLYRTYAWIPPDEPFSYESWCAAVRSGRTYMTGGPLLRFTVNGEPIGSTLHVGGDGATVEVAASASCIFPMHALQLVHNGRVAAEANSSEGARELRLDTPLKVEGDGWLCVRCGGPGYGAVPHFDSWGRGIMAHTSPIYLATGADYALRSQDTMQYMLTLIDGSLHYIRNRAAQWRPGTVTHHHGHDDHLAFLEEPFHEAIAAIHRHMHRQGVPH